MGRRQMRILLIEDNGDHAALIRRHISSVRDRAVTLEWLQTLQEGLARLDQGGVDAVLLDLSLPDSGPTETLNHVVQRGPTTPIVVLTALNDLELAATAVRQGAQDYLVKSQINGELLVRSLHYAIERKWTEQHLKELNATLEERVRQRTQEAERRADQLRRLAAELTQTEQRERRRLAEILHDHLQQLLVAAKMSVDGISRRATDTGLQTSLQQVRQLLEESIQASRSLTVELSPPVLYDVGLSAALRWLANHKQQKYGLHVQLDVEEEVEPASEQLRALLFQAVRELLFNVIKYAEVDQARVTLRRSPQDEILVIVSDEGIGFDPRALDHSGEQGGFGLFSIRERLEVMGGSMQVDTQPERGARITLILPARPPEAALPAAEGLETGPLSTNASSTPASDEEPRTRLNSHGASAVPAANARPIRVLLAEDRQSVRQGLARVLREETGIDLVGEAADGQMALEMCLDKRPDVVLMDVSMPRMDGVEATRRILHQLPGVRVIGLSMHQRDSIAEAMCEAGAMTYLQKDGPIEGLVAAIHSARRLELT